jgi:hypothetical protein
MMAEVETGALLDQVHLLTGETRAEVGGER